MTDTATTRRRVIQGAGVLGVAGVVGGSVVTAQETPTGQTQGTALRVAHAAPDAPAVNVRLDDETVLEGLEFGAVSNYQTVEPGSYQLQIVEAGQGFIGSILGSQEDSVVYEAAVTIEEGTTYTAVAFGELGAGAAETPTAGEATPTEATPTAETPTETTPTIGELQAGGGGQPGPLVEGLAYGESATATVPEGEYRLLVRPADDAETMTPDGGATTPTPEADTPEETTPAGEGSTPAGASGDREFDVEILEDDLSSPPDGESRVRVFHAVPNLDDVTIVATPQGGGQDPPQTPGQGQGQGGGQGQGQGGGQSQGGGQGQGQGPPASATVTFEAGTVYSAFAVGYADLEAEMPDGETPEGADTTPANETATDATPSDAEAADGDRPAFELVVAETATDGERAQGSEAN